MSERPVDELSGFVGSDEGILDGAKSDIGDVYRFAAAECEKAERNEASYQEAITLETASEFAAALTIFTSLADFRDAGERAAKIASEYWYICPGQFGRLGSYVWRVLRVEADSVLLIAKDIVTVRRFDASSNVWAYSELRRWLNEEFLAEFDPQLRAAIVSTKNDVTEDIDKVFLLSMSEANNYFANRQDRIATFNGSVRWWWLRSPGSGGDDRAASVSIYGSVGSYGINVRYDVYGVRPALWLNLSSEIFEAAASSDAISSP